MIFSNLTFYGEINQRYYLILNCPIIESNERQTSNANEIIPKSNDKPYYYFIPVLFLQCDQGLISIKYQN